MPDSYPVKPATQGDRIPVSDSGLSIDEIESRYLWSIQPSKNNSLKDFASAFRQTENNACRLLQLWPHKLYLISDSAELAPPISTLESMMTDIRHGFCELSLGGENVFDFMKPYLSVDLSSAKIIDSKQLRCRFGQYEIICWWGAIDDIRIIIDRSYAQSFRNYLSHLMQRQQWNKHDD